MAANRCNYLVIYDGESQIYGCGSKEVALATPPPSPDIPLESKHIYFVTHHPDTGEVLAHELPPDEVHNEDQLKLKL